MFPSYVSKLTIITGRDSLGRVLERKNDNDFEKTRKIIRTRVKRQLKLNLKN